MLSNKVIQIRAERRKRRVRSTIRGTSLRPRLVVFRSNLHIYAQLVDDQTGKVISGCSSLTPDVKKKIAAKTKKSDVTKLVGQKLTELAKAKGIQHVVLDRSFYRYHGRVKALAEAARQGGLKF